MSLSRRQQEILDAAIEIIATKGIQELTIHNLSAKIGVSEPALYRHFENKLQILVTLLNSFALWSKEVLESIGFREEVADRKIEAIFLAHAQRFTEQPAMSAVLFSEEIFKNEPELGAIMARIMRTTEEHLTQIIRAGIDGGIFRTDLPLDHLAMTTMGTLRLLVTRWRLTGYGFDLLEESRRVTSTVVTLLRA